MQRILVTACTLATLCSVAAAQDYTPSHASGQINISGATLFTDFFLSPVSGLDYIDCDADGYYGNMPTTPFVDQLAPSDANSNCDYADDGAWWIIHARGVGSGNGLKELVDFQLLGAIPNSSPSENGTINSDLWWEMESGGPTGCGNSVSDWPIYGKDELGDPIIVGYDPITPTGVDAAILDVPVTWMIQGATGTPAWSARPTEVGYGQNTVASWDAGYQNALETLDRTGVGSLNVNVASPDADTVYDTPIAWVPIGVIGNTAIGQHQFTVSELQHLFVTGRLPNGRNLVACTRDIGSGTRNGSMNSLGVDPSFGRGDNLGSKIKDVDSDVLGPLYQPTNKGGSGHMEDAVRNCGLAVGYTGVFGSSRVQGDWPAGKYEVMEVMFDTLGGTSYVRPDDVVKFTDNALPANVNNSWYIGGPETIATVGDPFASVGDPYRNDSAIGDYVRNLAKSIVDFEYDSNLPLNENMPGVYMARKWTILAGIQALPNAQATFAVNASYNSDVRDVIVSENTYSIGAYGTYAPTYPKRLELTGGETYSDGSTSGLYLNPFTGTYSVGNSVTKHARNRVMGDFDGDGDCDIDDADELVAAVQSPVAWATAHSSSANPVIPEVIGDFNGDGNFDVYDVLYYADGLALAAGQLDRQAGFVAVDMAGYDSGSDTYYFERELGVAWDSGKDYEAGDARFDVAGGETAPGARPLGGDGVIDNADVQYVQANFADWSDLDQAAGSDLSCDMTGDLIVDQNDVNAFSPVLKGDANCDGAINAFDIDPFVLALVSPEAWQATHSCDLIGANDINGDGVINAFDIDPFVLVLVSGGAN